MWTTFLITALTLLAISSIVVAAVYAVGEFCKTFSRDDDDLPPFNPMTTAWIN